MEVYNYFNLSQRLLSIFMQFKTWFSEQFNYLGQCDRLRMGNTSNEVKWKQMIKNARPVSQHQFLKNINLTPIMDEGETVEEFLSANPEAKFYSSMWGIQPAYYMQVAGFEFIFVQ